jgi:hypothetical protein
VTKETRSVDYQAVVVFTAKRVETIKEGGGSGIWSLDPARARRSAYLVCTRNGHPAEWAEGEDAPEPHRSAFLIGRIAGVTPASTASGKRRWVIRIDRYALVDLPDVWQGWRNPVRYTTLDELGIDPSTLRFEEMPAAAVPAAAGGDGRGEAGADAGRPFDRRASATPTPRLTIADAKRGLAATFGVPEEAVEITIRA